MSENLRVNIWRDKFTSDHLRVNHLSKLSTLSEPSIVKFIENQSEHLSKLTLYHLKKRATRRSRRAREPSRIPLLFLRGLNKKNSMLKKFVFKKISTIDIPKSSKLHRYINKVRKLNVRQFASQTIRPRQLAPIIQTISPHYLDD